MFVKYLYYLTTLSLILLTSCTSKEVALEVQKPASVTIPRKVEKVFIDPKLINASRDVLNIKSKIISSLASKLNSLGRFQVEVGPPQGYDPNNETVGIIQGDVISVGEIDQGKVSQIASCNSSNELSDPEVSKGRRGLNCTDSIGAAVQASFGDILYFFTGAKPDTEDVIRFYRYQNLTFSAQTNFSFSLLGLERETLVIRSDNSAYGKRIKLPGYEHVDYPNQNFRGGTPPINEFTSIIHRTKPDDQVNWRKWNRSDETRYQEKEEILNTLVSKIITEFVQAISPYKTKLKTEVATGGNIDVLQLMKDGEFLKARDKISSLSEKESEDIYNLGLTFEAKAESVEDYEYAYQLYSEALEKSPGSSLYADGVGRMELRIIEAKKLKLQTAEQ